MNVKLGHYFDFSARRSRSAGGGQEASHREDPPGQPDQAGQVAPRHQVTEQAAGHHERGLQGHEDPRLREHLILSRKIVWSYFVNFSKWFFKLLF